ncbi:hypothetical protein CPB97_005459 [Podila verticillata]|nr:hypothetical protein CPB97_005459 [Podila verticillata]
MSSTTTTDVVLATSAMNLSLLFEHVDSLRSTLAAEIKEYHFHLYYFQNNTKSHESAVAIRNKLSELIDQGYVTVVPQSIHGGVNPGPVGPHVLGSFELWCPIEGFARLFSWFTLNRGNHSVLIHPLTKEILIDHTERAIWMGQPLPLDFDIFEEDVAEDLPLEHPELGLGYSAKDATVA